MLRRPPGSTLFPTRRSSDLARERHLGAEIRRGTLYTSDQAHHSVLKAAKLAGVMADRVRRSEEHTSELQSHSDLVCRLLLEKKKRRTSSPMRATENTTCPRS